jgi:hypothetical protein
MSLMSLKEKNHICVFSEISGQLPLNLPLTKN